LTPPTGTRETVLAITLLSVVALAFTWPLLASPCTTTVDAWFAPSQIWALDVLGQGLISEGRLVGPTTMLAWPRGGCLSIVGWSYLALLLPAQLLGLSSVAAVNIGVWLQLVAAGVATWLLARRLGASWAAASVAGLFYGLHPFAFHQLLNGQFSELCHWGPPLLAWLLLRLRDRPGWRPLLGLALCFGLLLASSPYSAVAGALLLAMMSCWWVRQQAGRRPSTLRLVAAAAAATLLGALPFLYYYLVLPQGLTPLLEPNGTALGQHFVTNNLTYASVTGWVVPPRLWSAMTAVPSALEQSGTRLTSMEHYLGWGALILAAFGAQRLRREPRAGAPGLGLWLGYAAVCVVIASGFHLCLVPYNAVTVGETTLPLPLAGVRALWPSVIQFATTYRVALGVLLVVALLAALGLDRLLARLKGWRRSTAMIACGIVLLGEGLAAGDTPHPLPIQDLSTPQVYRDLSTMDPGAAVLGIPWRPSFGFHNPSLHLLWQGTHRHPTPLGNLGEPQRDVLTPFILEVEQIMGHSRPEEQGATLDGAPARWFVAHMGAMETHQRHRIEHYLDGWATLERHYPDDDIRLYRLRDGKTMVASD